MDDKFGSLSHQHSVATPASHIAKMIIGLSVFSMVALLVVASRCGRAEEAEPATWRRALLIGLEDPELRVLQILGPPTCKTSRDDLQAWIYAFEGEGRANCEPGQRDLVVYFGEDGTVAAYDPEYGVRATVRTDVEQMRFRRAAKPTEPQSPFD